MYQPLFIAFFFSIFFFAFIYMLRKRSNSQSSVKSATSQKRSIDLDKIEVYLEYPCFICGLILGTAKSSIEHVNKIHGYNIPSRPKDQLKRPRHHRFFYVRDKNGQYTITENACPSCWFHCPEDDLECLNEHIREEHAPKKAKGKGKVTTSQTKPKKEDVKQEQDDSKDDKHVKFEEGGDAQNADGASTEKANRMDDSVMAELVKAFERFAQSMKPYTKTKG